MTIVNAPGSVSRENREILTNWQSKLADEAGEAFRQYQAHRVKSIESYLAAGRLLAEARASCERGQWEPFLKRASIGRRTAERMIQLSDAVANGPIDCVTVTQIGIRRTLELLSVTKRVDEAVANWRESWEAVKDGDDDELRSVVLQSYPDGPLTAALWL